MLSANKLKITTLVENTAQGRYMLGEWGLSILVQADGSNFLMDTGASPYAVVHNAGMMGIDLSAIDRIVLSHGHYDHTGGLTAVLSQMHKAIEIIAHPGIWDAKGVSRSPGNFSFAGLPYQRDELELLGANFVLTPEPTWLTDDIVTSGEEEMTTDFEKVEAVLAIRKGNEILHDTVTDDQSLYIKTDLGLIVILGCAHRGMINIIRHGMNLTGMDNVYMVIGGTHLRPTSEEQLFRSIAELREIGVSKIAVSHCTGMAKSAVLAREFGNDFVFNNAGTKLTFPLR
jgi:7,8-dihydropterin-6-yl-methyl-4-(beta-D-ribofuranosyl)aminobenzene 5'-phosphate synthase